MPYKHQYNLRNLQQHKFPNMAEHVTMTDAQFQALFESIRITNIVAVPKEGNFSKCVSRFDGKKDCDVNAFIDSMEMYKECSNVSDRNAPRCLPMPLEGFTASWCNILEHARMVEDAYGEKRTDVDDTKLVGKVKRIDTKSISGHDIKDCRKLEPFNGQPTSKAESVLSTSEASRPTISCFGCGTPGCEDTEAQEVHQELSSFTDYEDKILNHILLNVEGLVSQNDCDADYLLEYAEPEQEQHMAQNQSNTDENATEIYLNEPLCEIPMGDTI
ncbi:hypothetical protein FQA39_LY08412 [Lamprigera yunnana]|nr:hypothetical protein FQA39_LY08412 [Lamprigera yunnana]